MEQIRFGFRACTSRHPSDPELLRLVSAHKKMRARYQADPASAKKLGGVAYAAITMIGNVLLNLDETITKG
jgi:hypothetical protein